ncbi:aminopeptidase P family protein [Haloplanus rubicundus]|uniref:Aminopeptidase P family protein n=1 Tax=Haloplanus rubicundus TaxID=1547898 RepID=A0A345E2D2_9EURY|nr:Xaa-Pro peptidase family protein [Haloplanus rubicundus]AXG06354.1 aminopeptidase P family protein [Haloplanus rubicundus]
MTFGQSEFETRYESVRTALRETEMDAVLVTNPETVEYLGAGAGLDLAWYRQFSRSIDFPTIAVVPETGVPTLIVHNVFEDVVRQATDGACELRTYYEGGSGVQSYVPPTVDTLTDICPAAPNVGIEIGTGTTTDLKLGVPLGAMEAIRERLPNAEFLDAGDVLRSVRMAKTDAEIDCIRRATAAIDAAFERVFAEIEPGMSETDVVAICNRLVSEHGARPVWTLACTNPFEILPRPDVTLDAGDTLFLDIGATVGGYHSDYNRMAVVGDPSVEQIEHNRIAADVTNELADAVEPGVTPADIVDRCRAEYRSRGLGPTLGLTSETKIGHSIGLTLSEAPQLMGYDETTLEPGMVLCIEPAVLTDEAFFMSEQIVIVTDDGSEIVSSADQELASIT